MARDIIRTPNAPSPPPTYSQAVRAAGLVFVSGTGPQDPASGKIVGDTIQEHAGAGRGNRTPTGRLAPADFKSAASANFAIPARFHSSLGMQSDKVLY